MKQDKQELYNKIIKNISHSIIHVLSENTENFNIADYKEDDEDTVNSEIINNITIKKFKSLMEEQDAFEKTNPSVNSISMANVFIKKIKSILAPLTYEQNHESILQFLEKTHVWRNFTLTTTFSIKSNLVQDNVINKYTEISFECYQEDACDFIFTDDIKELAKMIEFCAIYKNPLTCTIFINRYDIYKIFKYTIKTPDVGCDAMYISPLKEKSLSPYINTTLELFEKICSIYQEFVEFILEKI